MLQLHAFIGKLTMFSFITFDFVFVFICGILIFKLLLLW